LKAIFIICPVLGLAGLAGGYTADVAGWWERYPFLSNLASNVVSALFGIPLVYVILQRLANKQSTKVRELALQKRRCQAVERLRHSILTVVRSGNVAQFGELRERLVSLQQDLEPIPDGIQEVQGQRSVRAALHESIPQDSESYVALRSITDRAIERLEAAATACSGVFYHRDLEIERWWSGARRAWQVLDRELRHSHPSMLGNALADLESNLGPAVSIEPYSTLFSFCDTSGLRATLAKIRDSQLTYQDLKRLLDTAMYPPLDSRVHTAITEIDQFARLVEQISLAQQGLCASTRSNE